MVLIFRHVNRVNYVLSEKHIIYIHANTYMYMYIYTYTHTYTHIFIFIYVYMYGDTLPVGIVWCLLVAS